MTIDRIARRVLERFLRAANVVNFPGRHLITIAGRKYVLSDYSAMGGPEDLEQLQGGARVIVGPLHGSKWKYLWVYDTERQIVAMWRVTDGNEKYWGSARSAGPLIAKLEKKRHLNRIEHDEFLKIKREMDKRADDNERAMLQTIRDNESEFDKRVNQLVEQYFDRKVRPEIERVVSSIHGGVTPLGFRPYSPDNLERQKTVHVMGQVFERVFSFELLEKYLDEQGISLNSPSEVQQVDWARSEIMQRAYDEFLPPRVP